jgi:hypothetical protein
MNKLILSEDVRHGDAAAEATSRFEQLHLLAERARRAQGMTPTTWVVTHHIPGMTVVRLFLTNATRVDVMERLDDEIGLYLTSLGLTITDAIKVTCPVRVALARYSVTGEIVVEGNWSELMDAASHILGAHLSMQAVTNGPDDLCDLEVFATGSKALNG